MTWGPENPSAFETSPEGEFKEKENFLFTHFVASSIFFLEWRSLGSVCCLFRYSETALAGNSVSQMYPKSRAK